MPLSSGYFESLLTKIGWAGLVAAFRAVTAWKPPTSRRGYIRDVRTSLASMPFLYRSVELDAKAGFVDIDLAPILRGSLFADRVVRPERPTFNRVRETKRGLFLGHAGMGKTTFFRFTILSLIDKTSASKLLNPSQDLVPIYVPLKALDNSRPSPILRYVTTSYPYFRGRIGLFRLRHFARESRLFLVLDGFDELPLVGGVDFAIQEINAFFSAQAQLAREPFLGSEFETIYAGFLGCRVWLSTRREFFNANPIALDAGSVTWSIEGIGRRRLDLARRIFEQYQLREPELWRDKLNPERFLQQVDVAAEVGLEEMSKNPLFLTIMCFVYVQDLRDERDPEEVWRNGVDALVSRCIQALLYDVDESKTRGLRTIEREALLARRSAWTDEKHKLLEFLAGQAFLQNKTVFTMARLVAMCREYFSSVAPTETRADIVRGLDSKEGTRNIAIQIVFSGLLILTEKTPNEGYFDFPHRHFKEVLAKRFFEESSGVNQLLDRTSEPHLAEILISFYRSTQWQTQLLDKIAQDCVLVQPTQSYRVGTLFLNCLLHTREGARRQSGLVRLLELLCERANGRSLPREIIEEVILDVPTQRRLATRLVRAAEEGDPNPILVLAPVIGRNEVANLRETLEVALSKRSVRSDADYALVQEANRVGLDLFSRALRTIFPIKEGSAYNVADVVPLYAAILRATASGNWHSARSTIALHFDWLSRSELRDDLPTTARLVQEYAQKTSHFEWAGSRRVIELDAEAVP